jgi:hypothetical protein
MRRLRATLFLSGLLTTPAVRSQVLPAQYQSANYQFGIRSDTLTVFPTIGRPIKNQLPFRLKDAAFAPDGKSIYGVKDESQEQAYISRIEFNPIRATEIAGSSGLVVKSFAISSRQDRLVVSGDRPDASGRSCGLFEILIPDGTVRQLASSNCRDPWRWDHLSLSPSAEQAVATAGSNRDRDLRLELLDLVHGTAKSVGSGVFIGVWSPDGNWIAARENSDRDELFLIDANDFSRRRAVGGAVALLPTWSPDSHFLLLWKDCGLHLDPDPRSTLETLDIRTGKRTTIRPSQCQVYHGTMGWISEETVR